MDTVNVTQRHVNASLHNRQSEMRTNNNGTKTLIKFDASDLFAAETFADEVWKTERNVKETTLTTTPWIPPEV
jgi:hypothetical protein